MKSHLFASPNLKLIFAAALFVAAFEHCLDQAQPGEPLLAWHQAPAMEEVQTMVELTFDRPTPEAYGAVSQALLLHGDLKGALFYSRKASLAAELEP